MGAAQPNPYVDFVRRYYNDPVAFVREVLGAEPDEWQAEELEAIAQGSRRLSVASGHGVGKSTFASWAMIWYASTRAPVKVVVTAPSSPQLYDALFAEMKSWIKRLPEGVLILFDVKSDRVELKSAPEEVFISARTSRAETPEALQGVHSENVMLVADEASGIPEAVFEAAAGSMSGHNAVTLLLGNPTKGAGFFYDTHHKLRGRWRTRVVSCFDSPRVSQDYIDDIAARYGADSNAYRVRVLGLFPRSDDDTLIALDIVEAAAAREVEESPLAAEVWGVDVARYGDDDSALAKRKGNTLREKIRTWSKLDTMGLVGVLKAEWDALDPVDRPVEILVDVIGMGAGVVDRLIELELPARGVNVSETPSMAGKYVKLRDELWGECKAWLTRRDCSLVPDPDLEAELVTPRYKIMSDGKLKVEGKDEMKRRGFKSPNRADALNLTFASDAATAAGISNSHSNWNKPLRRNAPVV